VKHIGVKAREFSWTTGGVAHSLSGRHGLEESSTRRGQKKRISELLKHTKTLIRERYKQWGAGKKLGKVIVNGGQKKESSEYGKREAQTTTKEGKKKFSRDKSCCEPTKVTRIRHERETEKKGNDPGSPTGTDTWKTSPRRSRKLSFRRKKGPNRLKEG